MTIYINSLKLFYIKNQIILSSMDGHTEEFYAWSQILWARVDTNTWEILQQVRNDVESLVEVQTSGNILSVVGEVSKIGKWGEDKVDTLLNGLHKMQNAPFDFVGKGLCVEVKTSAVGNASIIKTNQLGTFARVLHSDRYYALVFYKTTDGKKVMLPNTDVSQRLAVEDIFIFPIEYIIYYFNTSGRKKIQIRSWNEDDSFMKIHRTSARALFSLDTGTVFTKRELKAWGKKVCIVEYSQKPLPVNQTFI